MIDLLFSYLEVIDDFLWNYVGFPFIVILGLLFSFKSGFVQIRHFPEAIRIFFRLMQQKAGGQGVHPIKAFFACVGGCIGIGNVVGVCTAVQIGGPGAMFWVWVTAICGMTLKYAEIYLGMIHRKQRADGGYDGGPMYFLAKAFKQSWIPGLICVLLCIYGVELFQFRVTVTSLSEGFGLNHLAVTIVLLILVMVAVQRGIGPVATICSWVIPIFFVCYYGMGLWVCAVNYERLPQLISDVFVYAFTPYAALGGALGGVIITISQGIRRGCYSSDVGVGYASVIHSESSSLKPSIQASLAIIDIFLDAFLICTMSMMIILITGRWEEPIDAIRLVQTALSDYFPHMDVFMPVFLVLLGYTTVIAYYSVGLKAADFLGGRKARLIYNICAGVSLFAFAFVDTYQALMVMSITQLGLVVVNLSGIYRLRHELSFDFAAEAAPIYGQSRS